MSGLFGNPLRVFVLPTSLGVSVILRITLSALAVSLRVSNRSQAASYTSTVGGSFSSPPKAAGNSVHALLPGWGDPAIFRLRLHVGAGPQEALDDVQVAIVGRPVQGPPTSDMTTPPGVPFPGEGRSSIRGLIPEEEWMFVFSCFCLPITTSSTP